MKTTRESYPPDWAKVTLMVSPEGEMQAIAGDQTKGEPGTDLPFIGLERIKAKLSSCHPSNRRSALLTDGVQAYDGRAIGDMPGGALKVFETWVFAGVRFIAVKRDGECLIADETGAWYGGYLDVASFRKAQPVAPLAPRAQLIIRTAQ